MLLCKCQFIVGWGREVVWLRIIPRLEHLWVSTSLVCPIKRQGFSLPWSHLELDFDGTWAQSSSELDRKVLLQEKGRDCPPFVAGQWDTGNWVQSDGSYSYNGTEVWVSTGMPGQPARTSPSALQFLTFLTECPLPLRAPSCIRHLKWENSSCFACTLWIFSAFYK